MTATAPVSERDALRALLAGRPASHGTVAASLPPEPEPPAPTPPEPEPVRHPPSRAILTLPLRRLVDDDGDVIVVEEAAVEVQLLPAAVHARLAGRVADPVVVAYVTRRLTPDGEAALRALVDGSRS